MFDPAKAGLKFVKLLGIVQRISSQLKTFVSREETESGNFDWHDNWEDEEYGEDERVFPLGSDANKLALFEQMVSGELDEIHGLHFKKVKARVVMDTEKTIEALETNLPMEIADRRSLHLRSQRIRGSCEIPQRALVPPAIQSS